MTKRLSLISLAVLLLAAAAWWILPGSFAHGVIVGLFAAIVLVLGGMVAFARVMRRRLGAQLQPPPIPSGSWDYDMKATDLDGGEVDFEQFRERVLVLNFWATWCGPCIAEMPSLERLRQAAAEFDVAFACVTDEEPEKVRRFLDKHPFELPVYSLEGQRPDCFKARAIPATFILDKTGAIALRHLGAAAWDDEQVITFVRGLAAAPR